MDIEEFISEIAKRPAIWKAKHPHHKHKHRLMMIWEGLRKHFKVEVDELKKKWKNLKDTYRKELRKFPETGDPDSNNQSQWRYAEEMMFMKEELMPYINTSIVVEAPKQVSNETKIEFVGMSDDSRQGTCDSPQSETYPLHAPQDTSPQGSIIGEAEMPHLKRKRTDFREQEHLQTEFLEIEKKKLKIFQQEIVQRNSNSDTTSTKKSDDYFFLMSLLPEIEKLPILQRIRLRNKINDALMEEISLQMYGNS